MIENGSRVTINTAIIAKPSYLFDSIGSIINDDRVDFRKISLSYLILKGWLLGRCPLCELLLLIIISGIFKLWRGMMILLIFGKFNLFSHFIDPFGDSLLAHHEATTFFVDPEAFVGAPLALGLLVYVHSNFIINTVMIRQVIIIRVILTWFIVLKFTAADTAFVTSTSLIILLLE